jgi:diacylglycerol kinase family enzyme
MVNPGASRAEAALPALSSWFTERCDAVSVVSNSKKERKRKLKADGKDADLIVIGGGDGTISKALPQLLKLNKPFAALPLGTANDFARTIGLPPDPLEAAEVALSGREHRIDVGLVNDWPYLNIASVGVAKLDLYLVYPGRFWQLFASIMHLKFRVAKPEVLKRLSAVTVALRTDRPRSVDVDGELATETPARFGLRPKALTVWCHALYHPITAACRGSLDI